MITQLHRLILLMRFLLAAAVMRVLWRDGFAAAIGGALLVFCSYEVLLIPRFLMLLRINRGQATPVPALHALPAAWWRESLAFELTFSWFQPFAERQWVDEMPVPGAVKPRRGVLLLHGYACNRGLWNDWMSGLNARGHPFVALSLAPPYGSIDDHTGAVDAALQRLAQATGLPPVIVGHSMGGLVARAWWRRHGGADRVHRVITLGTPHAGTQTASLGPTLNARQMRLQSDWLQRLAVESPPGLTERVVCYYSNADQTVCPTDVALLPGSEARHRPGLGHLGLLTDASVMAEVFAELA